MDLLIRSLNEEGYRIDLMLDNTHTAEYPHFQSPVRNFRQLKVDQRLWWRPGRTAIAKRIWEFWRKPLAVDPTWFRNFSAQRYQRIIAVDPLGIATAARLNARARAPLVYLSFELLLSAEAEDGEEIQLKQAERAALQNCPLILIQDPERGRMLAEDNGIDRDRMCYVPVAPVGGLPQRSDYLREQLGISRQQRIVLFQGTLGSWSGRDEWDSLLACWPNDVTLVIHSRRQVGLRHRKLLTELASRYPVCVTDQPVSHTELAKLTASADVGLVSYCPNPDYWHTFGNLKTIGLASGKFATLMMCGVPVLANRQTSLARLVETHRVGTTYDTPTSSAASLTALLAARDEYAANARAYYANQLDPRQPMALFMNRLRHL